MNLDLLLNTEIARSDAQEQSTNNSGKLRLSKGVYEKIKLYAELNTRITNTGMECYGYLLRPKFSTNDIISQVIFADDQLVSSAYVQVTDEGIRKALETVEKMDAEIVGWWHSHGTINVFHSGTDVANFRRVLDGVAPHTMQRFESAPYVVDEEHKRVVFADYALLDLQPEELAVFKNRQLPAVKKVNQDPFAFSLVVNNYEDRYMERASKTKDARGEFQRNQPIHPSFEVVNVPNDLEFLVADVEWEIREKIIQRDGRGYSSRGETSTTDKIGYDATEKITTFIDATKKYRGKNAPVLQQLLEENRSLAELLIPTTQTAPQNIAESVQESTANAPQPIKRITIKKETLEQTALRLQEYIAELPAEEYTKWNSKMHLFNRQHVLSYAFISEFGEKPTDETIEKYQHVAEKVNTAFTIADPAMKALTKYAMEPITDYNGKKDHHYRHFIAATLTQMCTDSNVSFEEALKKVTSRPGSVGRNKVFIWEDRFNICDQLVLDSYKNKSPNLTAFFKDFAEAYQTAPEKLDKIIENGLLAHEGVAQRKYDLYKDTAYASSYTRQLGMERERSAWQSSENTQRYTPKRQTHQEQEKRRADAVTTQRSQPQSMYSLGNHPFFTKVIRYFTR